MDKESLIYYILYPKKRGGSRLMDFHASLPVRVGFKWGD